jgi:hypothetical protein
MHSIAREIQTREGWTDETLLDVVLDYIENQNSSEAFKDYLEDRAEVESGSQVPGPQPLI